MVKQLKFLLQFSILLFLVSCGLKPSFKTEKFTPPAEILGCRLDYADNYNSNATLEDGTCTFTRCLDSTQDNFNNSNIDQINEYLLKYDLVNSGNLKLNCSGRSACIHPLASNRDPIGTIENGSCLFKSCMDDNYHEFIENDYLEIDKYLLQWGNLYQSNSRVESTCHNKKKYCQHPDAFNFTGPNVQKGTPYCTFYACTKPKFEGYSKYTEYLDFLKNYPGEIIEDNSNTRCGAKLVSKNVKELDVNRGNLKTPVDVVFIVDDSRSMDDEISRVREGLINIAPTLQNFNAQINLELHKLDNVNKTVKNTEIVNNLTSKITRSEYLRPTPVKTININSSLALGDIQDGITKGMDLVQASYGDGEEKGDCYIQRILESFKTSASKNLVTVLLTDEDDNFKGSSKNCYIYSDNETKNVTSLGWKHTAFKDKSGKDDLNNVITEGVIDLPNDKKFGHVSIHWDKFTSQCTNNQGSHAETYIKLISQLNSNGKKAVAGDICEKDYGKLLDETLSNTIREIIGFKYLVSSLDKNPVVQKIEIITINNDVIELNANDYQLIDDQKDLYVQIDESFGDTLKNSKKIRITVIEDQ